MMSWDQVLQLLLKSDAALQTLKDQCDPAAYVAAINQNHVSSEWEEVESFLMEAFEDSAQASLIWSGYTYGLFCSNACGPARQNQRDTSALQRGSSG